MRGLIIILLLAYFGALFSLALRMTLQPSSTGPPSPPENDLPALMMGKQLFPEYINRNEFMPKNQREKYYPTERFGPNKRIVVNLGMPRTGTNSWISMMKGLYYNSGEFHRIFDKYEPHDLAELLLLGNSSSPSNPLHRTLVEPPANGDIRAVADHPLLLTGVHRQGFPPRLLGPGDERDRSARQQHAVHVANLVCGSMQMRRSAAVCEGEHGAHRPALLR